MRLTAVPKEARHNHTKPAGYSYEGMSPLAPMHHTFRCTGQRLKVRCRVARLTPCRAQFTKGTAYPGEEPGCGTCEKPVKAHLRTRNLARRPSIGGAQ